MCAPVSGLEWIAGRIIPEGGFVIVQVEAHFDESGTHVGSPVLCVAGYIMEKGQASELIREWNDVLQWSALPRPLRYFRMSECAPGNGEFEGIDKKLRIQVASRMIGIIKRRTVTGLAVTMNEDEYNGIMPLDKVLAGRPYTFCAQVILAGVSSWIDGQDKHQRVDATAYFFESGHDSQPEADWLMHTLFKSDRAREAYRYAGHGFVPKIGNPGVQAADLLSWQWYTDRKHRIEGRPRRKDCASLLAHPHVTRHLDAAKITEIAERMVDISRPFTTETLHFGDVEE
jgi:hypothetical protein